MLIGGIYLGYDDTSKKVVRVFGLTASIPGFIG